MLIFQAVAPAALAATAFSAATVAPASIAAASVSATLAVTALLCARARRAWRLHARVTSELTFTFLMTCLLRWTRR